MKITNLEEVGPGKPNCRSPHPAPCPWCPDGTLVLIHSARGDMGFRRRLYECDTCHARTITQEIPLGRTEKRYVAATYRPE